MTTHNAAPGARILLTGCTGFVGKVVLEEILRRRAELNIERIYVLIRPRRNRTPAQRFERDVAASRCFALLEPGWRDLCEAVGGDITHRGLGIAPDEAERLHGELTHIVNCAASIDFHLPIAEAADINITGALNVLGFARECRALTRLVHVSTAYVTPHPGDGVPVEERLVDLPIDPEDTYVSILAGQADEKALLATTGHANTYTFTKCLAEVLLSKQRGDIPLTLLRPSIVSACRRYPAPGWIDSRAAYAGFVSLLGAGYLRVIRADPEAKLDVMPCDDVADRIVSCTFDPALQQPHVVRHAVAGLAQNGAIGRLAGAHERYFQTHPHERPARWAYLGNSEAAFRFNAWVHHDLPVGMTQLATRLIGKKRASVRARRLSAVLEYMNKAFPYFLRHSFDFRSAFPPLQDFDLDSYLDSISKGVSEHLLRRNPTEAPLRYHGGDVMWAMRQPDGNATVRTLGVVVRKSFRHAGAEITFNEAEIKAALRHAREGDLIVIAPSHRSYLDFLIVSLLAFAHPGLGLKLPKVAATDDFARIPIVGGMLRRAGAFYIRRGLGRADPQLTKQVTELVQKGHSLEFYPEGTRSRSGRFLAPKRGILRALQATGRPALVLPLCITYERLAEEEGFLQELDGRGKHKGGLGKLSKWAAKARRGEIKLGRIHIRCGNPQRLEPDSDVHALSRTLIAELQRHSSVTTLHLDMFCRRHAARRIDPADLRRAIERRGGLVLQSAERGQVDLPVVLQRMYEGQWMHLFFADALARVPDHPVVQAHVRRHGFWYPDHPNQFGDPVADAVVEALFQPMCHDFARVARAVEGIAADETFTAYDLHRRVPGAFLGDVENALDDLCERGTLVLHEGRYRWADGPRDLTDYRSQCAWPGLQGAMA